MTRNWQKSPFVLLITVAGTLTFGSAAHSETLNWQATPLYGTVSLTAGFQPDPHLVEIDAGGTTNVEPVLKNNCLGYVNSEAPDVDVNYTPGSYPLTFSVMSDADTTLVIYDPDGNWYCNDDFSGESHSNPGVVFERPPAGNYNVWVGTYGNDGNTPKAIIRISEARPDWSALAPTQASSPTRDDIEWGDDGSQWANDDECDDPRFAGPGAHETNVAEDRYHDATDCRTLYERGQVYLK